MQPPVERPLWNPYVAGFVLGLVLLGSFLVMGFGLGSSSVPTRLAIGVAHAIAPAATEANAYFGQYVGPGKRLLEDWLVFEVLGVFLGGLVGAYSGGRLKSEVIRGEGVPKGRRIAMAIAGGVIMGFAARLARGCTSGQALTGGAVLSLGSWIFMMCVFAGGYLVAPFLKREWR
jgi:hypothetical protein